MKRHFRLCFGIVAMLALTLPLRASDPVGVYCLIDKVVLEPNDTAPTTIQIWGAFSFAVPMYAPANPPGTFGNAQVGDLYGAVATGYLYLTCPAVNDSTCRKEWADLKSVAGKHQIVGFGGRHKNNGRVRKADEKVASPDAYMLNVGVVPLGSLRSQAPGARDVTNRTQYPDLAAALEAALKRK